MRDHHAGHTNRLDDVDQLELSLLAQLFVECAQRLVEQQQLGPLGQAAGQGHALLLAARQLVRLALGKSAELHQTQHLLDACRDVRLGHTFAFEAEGNVVPDAEVRKQCIRLEHHVDGPLVRGKRGDVHTVKNDRAGGRRLKAGQHAQQR